MPELPIGNTSDNDKAVRLLTELLEGEQLHARPDEGISYIDRALTKQFPHLPDDPARGSTLQHRAAKILIPEVASTVRPLVAVLLQLIEQYDPNDNLVFFREGEPAAGMFPPHPFGEAYAARTFVIVGMPFHCNSKTVERNRLPYFEEFAIGGTHDLRGITVEHIRGHTGESRVRVHLSLGTVQDGETRIMYLTLEPSGMATLTPHGMAARSHRITSMGIYLPPTGQLHDSLSITSLYASFDWFEVLRKLQQLVSFLAGLAEHFQPENEMPEDEE